MIVLAEIVGGWLMFCAVAWLVDWAWYGPGDSPSKTKWVLWAMVIVPMGVVGAVYGAAMFIVLGAAVYLFAVSAPTLFAILMIPAVIVGVQVVWIVGKDIVGALSSPSSRTRVPW